jgi:hypothetical protein
MAELGNNGQKRRRRSSIVLPSVLILLGILLLLQNLGFVDWNVWMAIARFWPLILIALGLELILGRGSVSTSVILIIILIIIAGSGLALRSSDCKRSSYPHESREASLRGNKRRDRDQHGCRCPIPKLSSEFIGSYQRNSGHCSRRMADRGFPNNRRQSAPGVRH